MKTTRGFYRGLWVAVALLLGVLTATPALAQDLVPNFYTTRERVTTGTPIQFFNTSTGLYDTVYWEFGDGFTSTETDPIHSYATNGTYDVTLTITDSTSGSAESITKSNWIEVMDPPFAEFTADVRSGAAPLLVNFMDLSVGDGTTGDPTAWAWDLGDETTAEGETPEHQYDAEGVYEVTLVVTFADASTATQTKTAYIVVGAEEEEPPTATYTATDQIVDGMAVLQLSGWMPLYKFTMVWDSDDDAAPRVLGSFAFNLKADPADDRPWQRFAPEASDFYDFAVFYDVQGPGQTGYQTLDGADNIVGTGRSVGADDPLRWNPDGYQIVSDPLTLGGQIAGGSFPSYYIDNLYEYGGSGQDVARWWELASGPKGNSEGPTFFVAFRTSVLWRNGTCVSYNHTGALMHPIEPYPYGDPPPVVVAPYVDDNLELIDSYDPDFPNGEALIAETGYSSSFSVYNFTPGPWTEPTRRMAGNWDWPTSLYGPIAEYRRPRWDVAGQAFDFMSGELVELRRLLPLEQWSAVIGINMHGPSPSDRGLSEVNVILTDEGADPMAPQGSGGFDPQQALDPFTSQAFARATDGDDGNGHYATGLDFSFNGCWVYHDTNNNGVFDEPQQLDNDGVYFEGRDYPLWPRFGYWGDEPGQVVPGLGQWQYIPYPPGGGPPWWKIKLRFMGDRRYGDPDGQLAGYLEPVPDSSDDTISSKYMDYFVVVRPDSGYFDISQRSGDGVGAKIGADFKVSIEPRRFNAATGFEDGGIHAYGQGVPASTYDSYTGDLISAWQDDPIWDLWNVDEPWWTQRTMNLTTVKPCRIGCDVHDLVLTYESNNLYRMETDNCYYENRYLQGYITYGHGGYQSWFDAWMDPFGLESYKFLDFHSVGVDRWWVMVNGADDGLMDHFVHFPYETIPFYNEEFDVAPYGPRSAFYPTPPTQPTLPTLGTWPATLDPGEYPRESDWSADFRKARYLKQHIEPDSGLTAMLGLNFTAADDIEVNQLNRLWLQQIVVAFWGPTFTPSDLLDLDEDGASINSGALLVEDLSGDGVFGFGFWPGHQTLGYDPLDWDQIVPVNDLAWELVPQYVDVTGDGVADDMDGDGQITTADKAWLLKFKLKEAWPVPVIDADGGYAGSTKSLASADADSADGALMRAPDPEGEEAAVAPAVPSKRGKGYWAKEPELVQAASASDVVSAKLAANATKAIGPSGNPGDDLFIVVRTSDTLARFEQFRAFVPSYAPARLPNTSSGSEQLAGFKFTPQNPVSLDVYKKFHPEEGPVQEYYGPAFPQGSLEEEYWEPNLFGFDLLEANCYCEITDLVGVGQRVYQDSGAVPVIGLNLSTNRGNTEARLASGTSGAGASDSFIVSSASWTAGAYTGCFLIDNEYEAYEITGNDATTLFLESGTPRTGAWFIVKNPTFLEQVIVEFYDEGRDGQFDILEDLLPLSIDQTTSGVALYRDNDMNSANTNGVFDEDIDIPIPLDYAPFQIGQVGEPDNQVMFVFSTPGTDNVPVPRADQTRHRQWIPDTLGTGLTSAERGDDFFIVIRTSAEADLEDDFRVAVVSCGPNTPTEPDPDTFPPPPTADVGEFDIFSEFPWGYRAIGLITFFRAADTYGYFDTYYSHGVPDVDNSGYDWVRSSVNKSEQTATITITEKIPTQDDVTITSVVPSTLPKTVPAGGLALTIHGSGFGTSPTVTLDSVTLTVDSASDTVITCTIPGGTVVDTDGNLVVVLTVTNPSTSEKDTYSGFSISDVDPTLSPAVTAVSPDRGGQSDFPVAVLGSNFDDPIVFFGVTNVTVESWTPTRIDVAFPIGGFPVTGAMDVTVRNQTTSLSDVLIDGFTYVNPPSGTPKTSCFIATAAYGSPLADDLDTFRAFRDGVLLKSATGTALVDMYYSTSPAVADYAAAHPWFAGALRIALTPVAWALRQPVWALVAALAAFVAGRHARRMRRGRVRA